MLCNYSKCKVIELCCCYFEWREGEGSKKRSEYFFLWIKLRRIRVPIRGSSTPWYLSRVEARYWKLKTVVTRILISSLIGFCQNTNMIMRILIHVRTFLVKIHVCLMKLIENESWIVEADYGCLNSSTQIMTMICHWLLHKLFLNWWVFDE